jgi:NitT/TauT family transport system substrate-binding protein
MTEDSHINQPTNYFLGGVMYRFTNRVVVLALLALFAAPFLCTPGFAQVATKPEAEPVEMRLEVPRLKPPAEYKLAGDVVEIELSEYAGYSGLVVANGGLEPNENSIFFKKNGFKVKLTLSEEESWSALNSGKMAGSATTVDVLAAYGGQFEVTVPALIGFSRGADGIVVRKEIRTINDLRGKILSAAQFTESDFFIRYLAQVAGLEVKMLANLDGKPDPEKINLVFCKDGFEAADLFLRELSKGQNRLAGCVTWAPKTTEAVEKSEGRAQLLTTNANLLIVADILILNKGFAHAHPEKVKGLVEGLIAGNSMIREQPDQYLNLIGKVFKWDPEETKSQLRKVHLANYPENRAFFDGKIDSAGGFGYIYERAALAYGTAIIGKVPDSDHFLDISSLKSLETAFPNQKASLAPTSRPGRPQAEPVDITTRNVLFRFHPNSSQLEMASEFNRKELAEIAGYLRVSPGSTILLRGHADGSGRQAQQDFGGEAAVQDWIITLKALSKDRCNEVRRILEEQFRVDPTRLRTEGVGIAEPTGKGPRADRRVEVKWSILD